MKAKKSKQKKAGEWWCITSEEDLNGVYLWEFFKTRKAAKAHLAEGNYHIPGDYKVIKIREVLPKKKK